MIRSFLSILFLIVCTSAYSQTTIQGKLIDTETKQPIIGGNIYISKLEKGTITNLDGDFQLHNIPDGELKIVISFIGYTTKTISFNAPSNDPLIIELQPTAIEMEAVIVSTPFHKLQSENVVKVERESLEDLKKTGAVTLAEGITQIAGVESITTGAGIGKPVIRGLSANRVLVYAQGVRLENQQFGDEHGLGVSSSGVESVEVIKGPASLLYGSDALGGVLYLNPEKYAPKDSTTVDASLNYFTNSIGTEANLGIKTSGENWKYLVRGNYAAHSDYETGDGIRVTNSRFEEKDLKAGISFQDTKYKGDFRYNYNNTHAGIPEEIGEQSTSKSTISPYQKLDNHIASLSNKLFLQNSSLDLKVGYLFNNRKEFEEESTDPALEMHLETLNYDLKYNAPVWGNFETIFGVQGLFQTNKNFGEELLIPDASIRDFGVLGTTHYHLEKLDIQGGFRFDTRNINTKENGIAGDVGYFQPINRDFSSYNGSLGIKFNLFNNVVTRINAASGFRAPNLAELSSNGIHEGTNRYEVGNVDLENEQNIQLDLSLEYRNEHFELFGNAFYNKINQYIFIAPTDDLIEGNRVFIYTQDDAKLYGGEAGFHLHPHPIDWLHIESSLELVIGEKDNGESLPLIPATSFTNTLRVELDKLKGFSNNYSFVTVKTTGAQNKISDFETNTNGYSLVNAGIGGTIFIDKLPLEIRISGNNLFNKNYIAHLSRLKADGIANMGRNISFDIQTTF
ncbi:iron complex outermembrane receptor protein [Gillisia mitskevichiae]|uniref:Iron complex outermembrane receptor protein n=1 Tax=Gillisia mitskevichiae TaxID=270921 RepID=A0A495PUW6_9FLAO|nr:TonB-dependent receptor [Gillisia mitskevichiae]RKS53258.1 iron complex outermembrane receptor protein [Gillisia mitskevichiae]